MSQSDVSGGERERNQNKAGARYVRREKRRAHCFGHQKVISDLLGAISEECLDGKHENENGKNEK